MARRDPFGRIVRRVAERPLTVLAAVAVLALAGLALALRLEPSASTDTLVDRGSPAFEATERFRKQFGEEPVVILVKGELQQSILTADLGTLLRLEGCLSGNVPEEGLATLPERVRLVRRAQAGEGGVRARHVREHRRHPDRGGVLGEAGGEGARGRRRRRGGAAALEAPRRPARRSSERLANQARSLVFAQFTEETLRLALRYGLTSVPSLDNVDFVSQLVFDPSRGVGQPKARFAYLFPSDDAALIQIRMKPTLSESEREEAVDRVQEAVAHEQFRLERGGRYVVTGVPVVVDGLASAVKSSIFVLLAAALLVMAATLALVFRTRLRLLPLALALAAAALTFGAVSLAGASLTMASIAALPVLIGLAVDYCDPVPGALRGGRGDRGRAAGPPRRAPRRPPPRAARRSRPRGSRPRSASSCCCCRRSRWCAASGRCSWSGSSSRWPAR